MPDRLQRPRLWALGHGYMHALWLSLAPLALHPRPMPPSSSSSFSPSLPDKEGAALRVVVGVLLTLAKVLSLLAF